MKCNNISYLDVEERILFSKYQAVWSGSGLDQI